MAWYNRGKLVILDAQLEGEPPVDLRGDVVKIALMTSAYVPNIDTHDHFDDVTGELVATGYATRGLALASKTITQDDVNDRAEFDAADLTFSAIGNGVNGTFNQVIVLREQDAGVTNANTVLIATMTCAATLTNGGAITLQWNAEGILQLS